MHDRLVEFFLKIYQLLGQLRNSSYLRKPDVSVPHLQQHDHWTYPGPVEFSLHQKIKCH